MSAFPFDIICCWLRRDKVCRSPRRGLSWNFNSRLLFLPRWGLTRSFISTCKLSCMYILFKLAYLWLLSFRNMIWWYIYLWTMLYWPTGKTINSFCLFSELSWQNFRKLSCDFLSSQAVVYSYLSNFLMEKPKRRQDISLGMVKLTCIDWLLFA